MGTGRNIAKSLFADVQSGNGSSDAWRKSGKNCTESDAEKEETVAVKLAVKW